LVFVTLAHCSSLVDNLGNIYIMIQRARHI